MIPPTARSSYADSDFWNGYNPAAGEQGVVVDFENHLSAMPQAPVERSDFRGEYYAQASAATDWWKMDSARFPLNPEPDLRETSLFGIERFEQECKPPLQQLMGGICAC